MAKDKREKNENANEITKEKKGKFSIRKLIYNDKYLIIFSLVAAVIVWIAASMNLSPMTTKTITVPLNVDFTDSAADHLGLKCYGDETIDVDITISCKKYLAMDITEDDIDVTLQTNSVTSSGNSEVPIRVTAADDNADFTISSYYPTVYKAYFDVEEEKTMDIRVSYENDDFIEEGYIMGEPLLSENTAVVSGPKAYVSRVDSLVASVGFDEKVTTTQSLEISVTPVDSSGSEVDYVSVSTNTNNLTLTIPVLKEMTLDVTTSFTNVPTEIDVADFDISYSSSTVDAGVLEDSGVTEANIGNIDFSQLSPGINTFTFDVSNLENLVILDDIDEIEATVVIPSSYETAEVAVNASNVTVLNIPEGYEANVTSVSNSYVTVVGSEESFESGTPTARLVVDLSAYEDSLTSGSSEYTIVTSTEDAHSWVYGEYTATITISEKSN